MISSGPLAGGHLQSGPPKMQLVFLYRFLRISTLGRRGREAVEEQRAVVMRTSPRYNPRKLRP